jgi:hypothetical protein
MALTHILQTSCYVDNLVWSTGFASKYLFKSFDVAPDALYLQTNYSNGTGSTAVRYVPPMAYLSNIFQYWRGSIKFTFKVVKTEYHSGRIMAAFYPGPKVTPAVDLDIANADYVYREIFDLREASEFTLTVPYTATTPYLRYSDRSGSLALYVINQLTAPPTVSQTVNIIVEVSAGPDMEFAFPVPARMLPVIYSQSGIDFSNKLVAQGLGDQVQDPSSARAQNPTDLIGGISEETLDPARYCIGERVLSVRQLIKRASLFYSNADGYITSNTIDIYPYANWLPSLKLGSPLVRSQHFAIDMVSYFAPLFRYYRGGMRYKLIDNVATGQVLTATLRAETLPLPFPVYASGSAFNSTCTNQVVTTTQMQGGIELETPFYGYSHSRSVQLSASTPIAGPDLGEVAVNVSQTANYSTNLKIFRFAADDFSYGFFIGCPPLTTGQMPIL